MSGSGTNSQDELEGKIVEKLLNNQVIDDNGLRIGDVLDWFADDEKDKIEDILQSQSGSPDFPVKVETVSGHDIVYIPKERKDEALEFAKDNFDGLHDSSI